jgi:hypothetical protein
MGTLNLLLRQRSMTKDALFADPLTLFDCLYLACIYDDVLIALVFDVALDAGENLRMKCRMT